MNNHNEPSCKAMMGISFGSLRPALATFPHAIMKTGPDSLGGVLQTVNAKGACIGHVPLYDAHGEPYLQTCTDPDEEFKLWDTEMNQIFLREACAYAKLGQFTMVIDLRTPRPVLDGVRSKAGEVWYSYPDCIRYLAEWIPTLGWAYVPLSDEISYAMLIVGGSCAAIISKYRTLMEKKGVRTYELRKEGDRFHWPDEATG